VNDVPGEPDDEYAERTENGEYLVLQDVFPYCADPDFVRREFQEAMRTGEPANYLEKRSGELTGSRKGDIRILLNRLARSRH